MRRLKFVPSSSSRLALAIIEELKQDLDCRKCKVCALLDCKLAISYGVREKLLIGAREREELEAWKEDLRRTTIPVEQQRKKPDLADFGSTSEAWGHA